MRSALLVLSMMAVAGLSQGHQQPFRISLSVSPFTEILFKNGIVFTDGPVTAKNPEELQKLFVKYGANEVYARIATTRTHRMGFGDHSVTMGLERARMAKALNLPFNPELGLFNIYGDIRCQPAPDFGEYPELKVSGAWTDLTLEQMLPALRSYGAIAAREILKTGVKVRIWDIGNEVEFGVAGVAVRPMPGGCDDTAGGAGWYKGPDRIDLAIGKMAALDLLKMAEPARIAWLEAHVWPHEARIFAAVAGGIRSVDTGARFSTHVSGISAVLPAQAVAFFKAMADGGYLPDELGFSFYPSSTDRPPQRLQAFQKTMEEVQRKMGRPVFIAEFGYPAGQLHEGAFAGWNHALEKYPLTAEGQAGLLKDVAAWGVGAGVTGMRPWGPELAVPGWGPFALFAAVGKTLTAQPGLGAIAEGVRSRK